MGKHARDTHVIVGDHDPEPRWRGPRYGGRRADLARQRYEINRALMEYLLYAQSIGCEVAQDEIIGSHEQMHKLTQWLIKRFPVGGNA